jgi:hypothetical protein
MFSLSRLAITGLLNEQTPICVIREITEAHGLNYTNNLDSIHQAPPLILNKDLSLDDYKKLARFINKNVKWTTESLHQAYQFLILFSDPSFDESSILRESWQVGSQTPENPRSLNLTVLYSICNKNKLQTFPEMTPQHLERAVRLLNYSQEELKNYLLEQCNKPINKNYLIDLLAKISCESIPSVQRSIIDTSLVDCLPPISVTRRQLTDILSPLNNINALRKLALPVSNGGAIALAALNYQIDISLAEHPLKEYKYLRENNCPYIPDDLYLNKWYLQNKRLFSLVHYFNPLFSENYYKHQELINLALQEGYTRLQIQEENVYSLLTTAYYCQTFYNGIVPPLKDSKTLIGHEEIAEISEQPIYSYGIREKEMVLCTDDELCQLFEINDSFIDPTSKGGMLFSELSLHKLQIIGSDKLKNIIQQIRTFQELDPPTKSFVQLYRSLTTDNQQLIEQYLVLILELAMFMRGWIRGTNYPISTREIVQVTTEDGQIQINVTEAYAAIDKHQILLQQIFVCNNTLEYHLLNLPLVHQVEGKYLNSKNPEDGLTLGERLAIAKQESSNDSSCIRLTSNWLAATAHKYLVHLGKQAPFELQKLRLIS